MADEDTEEDFYVFEPEDRLAILKSVRLQEGELADKLILFCEIAADQALYEWDYYSGLPNIKEANRRIDEIYQHVVALIDLVSFGDDHERRNAFWGVILRNKREGLSQSRWDKFTAFVSGLLLAKVFLKSIKLNEKMFTSSKYTIDELKKRTTGNEFLKSLSFIYSSVLERRPGRSKSTIGPFVRFAHAVMFALAGSLTPPIETLNERWARLDFDPSKRRWNEDSVDEYCRKRGIKSPLKPDGNSPGDSTTPI